MLLFLACAVEPAPPAASAPMDGIPDAERTHAEWTFQSDQGRATISGPATYDLGAGVLQTVAFSPSLLVFARTGETPLADLFALDLATGRSSQLTDWPGYEDRPAFSPDGRRLAFFSGRTGLASLYVADVSLVSGNAALSDVIQLTNIGLERNKRVGGPPDGFVPPPDDGQVTWTDVIRWTAQGRTVEVTP